MTEVKRPPVGSGIPYERLLDCIHCGLCTSTCPTYLETGNENEGPRGRIHLMRAVVEERIELTHEVSRHLETCLDCRACETACPSGVQYGRLIEPFRLEMEHRKSGQWSLTETMVNRVFPYPNRLAWALAPARVMQAWKLDRLLEKSGFLKLLPRRMRQLHRQLPQLRRRGPALPERVLPEGERKSRVLFLTGCVAHQMERHVHRATISVLVRNGHEVLVPPNQPCCGAIPYHAGHEQPMLAFLRTHLANLATAEEQGCDAVISNVAGCGALLKEYPALVEELVPNDTQLCDAARHFSGKVRDVHEYLLEQEFVAPGNELPLRIAYQDACHLRHAQGIVSQPRQLLQSIPGLKLLSPGEPEICCGAAGSYNLTEPEMSLRLAHRKVKHLLETKPDAIATGNIGCRLQLQATFKEMGESMPVYHPMELLELAYRGLSEAP